MSQKQRTRNTVVWLRRLSQTAFLILFFYLFIQTTFHENNEIKQPVKFFFEIDPLVMIGTWLATHTIPAALLLGLITLLVTLVFGRWFCGWVCPFGTINNMCTTLRNRKLRTRVDSAKYSTKQRTKYYILLVFLIGAIVGWNAVGWLDPFSFLYRSLATAVYPAFSWITVEFTGWLLDVDPGVGPVRVTMVSEPVYSVLNAYVLPVNQPFYWGSWLIGALFLLIIALNAFRARFWCRYICPTGALLGVTGKNPAFRLQKDDELCNNCRLCIANCQGGAEPQKLEEGWKPSECFYCWNCVPACPSNAITFGFIGEKKSEAEEELHSESQIAAITQSPVMELPTEDAVGAEHENTIHEQTESTHESQEKKDKSSKRSFRRKKRLKRKRT